MKKVMLAFDGTNFPEAAFEFARELHTLQPILITGVFLPQALLANLWSYATPGSELFIPLVEPEESKLVEQNIARFETLCKENYIDFRVHKDFYDLGLTALEKESIFADLLILGSEEFYSQEGNAEATFFLEQALHDVRCPVLLVPNHFDFPRNIVFSYDGSEESIFAIKQFVYLFPELLSRPALVVHASKKANEDFPEKKNIEELIRGHFRNASFYTLEADPKKYFDTWVIENKNAIVVSGSYSRSGLSQFFKKSFMKDVIATHRLPVFIAHR